MYLKNQVLVAKKYHLIKMIQRGLDQINL